MHESTGFEETRYPSRNHNAGPLHESIGLQEIRHYHHSHSCRKPALYFALALTGVALDHCIGLSNSEDIVKHVIGDAMMFAPVTGYVHSILQSYSQEKQLKDDAFFKKNYERMLTEAVYGIPIDKIKGFSKLKKVYQDAFRIDMALRCEYLGFHDDAHNIARGISRVNTPVYKDCLRCMPKPTVKGLAHAPLEVMLN